MRDSATEGGAFKRLSHYTPLRYPGGKGKLADFVKEIIRVNDLADGEYIEPYAGGAAIAIELLLQEYVTSIYINDVSRAVHAFWFSVLNCTDTLCQLVRDTPLTVNSWDRQKRIFKHAQDYDDSELGFATFFLNRTNRSGILNGGIIGGRDQSGPWKIDARYNAGELIRRIKSIARLKSRVHLSQEDAHSFLLARLSKMSQRSLIYLDPPYYVKGKDLYYDFYNHDDHSSIAALLRNRLSRLRWLVSYDNVPQIRRLYRGFARLTYKIGYSARVVRKGSEVMFFGDSLRLPSSSASTKLLKSSSPVRVSLS